MVIVFAVKLALVAGTVWMTKELGVWDNPDRTSLIYEDIKCYFKPIADDLKEKYCAKDKEPQKPWRESFVDAYNDSIKECFFAAKEIPTYCERFADDIQKSLDQFFKPDAGDSVVKQESSKQ